MRILIIGDVVGTSGVSVLFSNAPRPEVASYKRWAHGALAKRNPPVPLRGRRIWGVVKTTLVREMADTLR